MAICPLQATWSVLSHDMAICPMQATWSVLSHDMAILCKLCDQCCLMTWLSSASYLISVVFLAVIYPVINILCNLSNQCSVFSALATLCKRCSHLLELDLSDSLRLTDHTVEIIRWHLPELRRLSLSRCYSILPSTIGILDALPNLQAINVMGMLTKEPLEALQAMLPKILLNKMPFSTVARPTTGQRRTSIWEQRVRENV